MSDDVVEDNEPVKKPKSRGRPRKITAEAMAKLRELAPSHCTAELAKILGIHQGTITYLCHKYEITLGKDNPNQQQLTARVPRDIAKAYQKEAKARNISLNSLIYRLLTNIAKDKLFNAVLDNEEDVSCEKPSKSSSTQSDQE